MAFLYPSLYLIFYAILHSILAMDRVKECIYAVYPKRYYRLSYSILSILLLIPLVFLPYPSGTLYYINYPLAYAFHAVQGVGLIGFYWALRHTPVATFLGWSNAKETRNDLVTTGPYAWCRHPLYFFASVILIAHPNMSEAFAILTVWILLYFGIGTYIEEARLKAKFGAQYQTYQATTPRLIPFIRIL